MAEYTVTKNPQWTVTKAPQTSSVDVPKDIALSAGQGVLDSVLSITRAFKDGLKAANFPIIGQIYGHSALADMIVSRQQHPENAAAIEKSYSDLHHFSPSQVETDLSNLYQPQTTAGEYIRAGVRGGTEGAAFGPAGIAAGVGAGLGGQAGGKLGDAMGYPVAGRVIGSLAGGMTPMGLKAGAGLVTKAFGNNAEQAARDAMKGMTPEDFSNAQAMQRQASATGVPLSGAESTGNNQLLGMQRTLEQQPGSAPVLADFYKNRPEQVTEAVNRAQVPIGVRGNLDPALVGADTQSAAELALKRAEQQRTNNTAQAYATADRQVVSGDAIKNLVARMDAAAAADTTDTLAPIVNKAKETLVVNAGSPAVKGTRVKGENGIYTQIPGKPAVSPTYATDIDNLDRAKKAIRDMADVKPFGEEAGAKEASKYLKNFVAQLDGIMKTSGPYKNAVADFAAESPAVDAKIAGTVGALTKTVDPSAQWKRLVDPALARADTVASTAKDLSTSNPDAYRNLVRVGIESEINAAFKATKNPLNDQTVGAAIASKWFSTPQRLENVRAAVANLPNGSDALKALDNVMAVLRQTGMRQTTGSPTASNAANVGALGPSSVANAQMHPFKGLGENLDTAFTKRSATNLAKILTDPNSVKLLKRIADFDPMQPYTSAGMATILNASQGNPDKR